MACCYTDLVKRRQPCLPDMWLITDLRNDARLERALLRMPRGSGLVFRHYHLAPAARRTRFDALARIARARGHIVVLAGSAHEARRWGADAAYGAPARLTGGAALPRLMTAHSLREIGMAQRIRADAILLSPVFPTRSHPGKAVLGPVRLCLLARLSRVPVIALGGMNRHRARSLRWKKWAAIDGI